MVAHLRGAARPRRDAPGRAAEVGTTPLRIQQDIVRRRRCGAFCACVVALSATLVLHTRLGAQSGGAPSTDSAVARTLRRVVTSGRHAAQQWPVLRDVARDLRVTYAASAWAPRWSSAGVPTASAQLLIQELVAIDARGLIPADYDAPRLAALAARPALSSAPQVAEFDVMLTVAALRVLRGLQFGRVPATAVHAQLRFTHEPYDVHRTLDALTTSANPGAILDEAEPPFLHYRLLKAAMAQLRTVVVDTSLARLRLRTSLRPGERHQGIPGVRRTLLAFGDLASLAPRVPDADSLLYDSLLVSAVQRFQRRHGLAQDGAIGATTLHQLRRPVADRIAQIALTMERWRWLPHTLSTPAPIIVNIPAFRLHAFTTNSDREADLLSMDVVVGQAFDHKTPVFSSTLRYLVFSPYWDVPPTIARKEILPLARRDRTYLARGGYEVVSTRGAVLGTSGAAVNAVAAGQARLRQRPGPKNALGGVKFIFPNAFNVYLHDTPVQSIFQRPRRDASHGCIRIAEPLRLAAFVLRDQPAWDSTHIADATRREAPLQVTLSNPVPLHVVYATAIARENGDVYFYADIYGHDRRLANVLARGYAIR